MGGVNKKSKKFIAVMVVGFLCILLQDIDKTACASGTATTSSSLDTVGRIIYADGSGEFRTINADGTDMKRLGIEGRHPSWSPDGNKFAYINGGGRYNDSAFYVATTDGKTNSKLVDKGNYLDWSPRGGKIAFLRNDSYLSNEVWTIKPDGTGETRVTTHATDCPLGVEVCWSDVSNLDFSPDGARFVANENVLRAIDDVYGGIFIFDADGTGVHPLNLKVIYGNHDNVYYPKWSPDGQTIALIQREYQGEDTHGIWIVNADGGSLRRIGSTDGLYDSCFAWSPDGTEIAAITVKGIQAFKADGSGDRLIGWERRGGGLELRSRLGACLR